MNDVTKAVIGMVAGAAIASFFSGIFIKELISIHQKELDKIAVCEAELPRNKHCELVAVPK